MARANRLARELHFLLQALRFATRSGIKLLPVICLATALKLRGSGRR